MEPPPTHSGATLRIYLTGFVLALVLTAIPFGLVTFGTLSRPATLATIAVLAIAQVLVHLRCFLHLNLSTTPRENILAIAFTAVLIAIMVGGSLWIMFDLHYRMSVQVNPDLGASPRRPAAENDTGRRVDYSRTVAIADLRDLHPWCSHDTSRNPISRRG